MKEIPESTPTLQKKSGGLMLGLVALILTLVGGGSYMAFLGIPWVRETAAPNMAAMLLGVGVAVYAATRRPRWPGLVATVLTVGMTGLFVFGVFIASVLPRPQVSLPAEALEVAAGSPFDFALPDHTGRTVRLSDFHGKGPVLLVFYRGFW